jgi:peptide/nickel transport system ATP-binding protein
MERPLLSIRGLSVHATAPGAPTSAGAATSAGMTSILRGIDLDLHRGTILGLVGESGSGKSTLGLASMGYVREGLGFSAGSIVFDGVDLIRSSEPQRRSIRGVRIAYVAQSAAASFNPARRLFDQSIEVAVRRGRARPREAIKRLIDLYTRLQLPNPGALGRCHPHHVSGGQLQRAMTAMAMVTGPDLIVFDEPTTALDVTTQIEVLSAIRNLVESSQTAAIYISHDLALVAQMADRIMVLRRGEIVEEAETREILRAPREAYTRSIWAANDFRAAPKVRAALQPEVGAAVPLLRVTGVTAGYGRAPVLHDATLEVHSGMTLAVVGESGSGKSSLANVIAGLLSPRAGTLEFAGRPLAPGFRRRSREQLRRIQLIAQSPDTALNPRQRVSESIGRPLTFYHGLSGTARERRMRELLAELELDPDRYADRFPGELSGGQKQRVCIARALAAEPSVIICDEVTSGLDQLVAQDTLKLLDRVQRERDLAYVFITHDLAIVRAIADDVVVMKAGRIVRSGHRDDVLAPPYDPYTALLLSSVPEMDPDWLDRVLEQRRGAR